MLFILSEFCFFFHRLICHCWKIYCLLVRVSLSFARFESCHLKWICDHRSELQFNPFTATSPAQKFPQTTQNQHVPNFQWKIAYANVQMLTLHLQETFPTLKWCEQKEKFMTNKFLKTKAFIPLKKQYKIHGEGEQVLPHSCTATKSMEKLFVENCRAIYVLTYHVLCSDFFHISSSSSSRRILWIQVLELASKIKPQERPSSSPSETWRKISLCASSCRFWRRLSSFDLACVAGARRGKGRGTRAKREQWGGGG